LDLETGFIGPPRMSVQTDVLRKSLSYKTKCHAPCEGAAVREGLRAGALFSWFLSGNIYLLSRQTCSSRIRWQAAKGLLIDYFQFHKDY